MIKIPFEEPPKDDNWPLTEYLNRMFMLITDSINDVAEKVIGGLVVQTPQTNTATTTPQKMVFDAGFPDEPLGIIPDPPNNEIILGNFATGLYEVTLYLNFNCDQKKNYRVEIYVDRGSGDEAGGYVFNIGTANNQDEATIGLNTLAVVRQAGQVSLYYYMDSGTGTFDVTDAHFYLKRL